MAVLCRLIGSRSPDSSVGKESSCNVGDLGSIPGLGRSPEEGKGYPPQYSGLENSTDVHGVTRSFLKLSEEYMKKIFRVPDLWQTPKLQYLLRIFVVNGHKELAAWLRLFAESLELRQFKTMKEFCIT